MPKFLKIIINALPIVIMIGLIPLIGSDYTLAGVYVLIIAVSLWIRHEPLDATAFVAGLIVMTISEYFFLQTGVETFSRNSLFGIMPLWLPVLWAYGFVVIKRATMILLK